MNLKNKNILVIGGAGFIGSFVVSELLKTNVGKVVIYDNFARGKSSNLSGSLNDPRCEIYPNGGDIRDIDTLNDAMKGSDAVVRKPQAHTDFKQTGRPVDIGVAITTLATAGITQPDFSIQG